ncbi:MAG: sortase [Clostridia bacterium]|nr:sortase [Clostridia bacterium]
MSKFGKGKRYADILTILLVIIIIAIIGLLGYFGYKAVNKKTIETNANNALEEFKKNTPVITPDKKEPDNEVSNTEAPVDMSNIISNTTQQPQQPQEPKPSAQKKKTYLGNYEIKGTINIPKTKIEYVILEKVTPDSLNKSVAILDIVSSSEMSEKVTDLNVPGTNAFILGHNYRNGMFFSDNDKLSKGDKIKITDQTGLTVTYTIYEMFYTTSSDTSFLQRDVDINTREITLQTCNDDSSQRLIIQARDN